jgi:hypothetical protein
VTTFKASRTISRDHVASFLRESFVEGDSYDGGEEPVGTGDLSQVNDWLQAGFTALAHKANTLE